MASRNADGRWPSANDPPPPLEGVPRMNVYHVLALSVQQPQDTVDLKPVVVTATRVPVAAALVASAVTVLRGSDLMARGSHAVAASLETVPGAHVVETGSFGGQTSLFMRGG